MFRIICSTLPYMVCLCWFVTFALHTRSNDPAKRILTVFLGTCSVLYLCHALYFNGFMAGWAEALWGLCSLSVYPLYLIYICHLTHRPLTRKMAILCLLPGILVALAMFLFPDSAADTARKVLNTIQIITVLYLGYKRLHAFDKEVADVYADTEGRDTWAIKCLLLAFVGTSVLSVVANALGKQFFASSDLLLLIALLPFSVLLYALSYIGYTRNFTMEQFMKDTDETDIVMTTIDAEQMSNGELGRKIEELMGNNYYLLKNLKITDLARETGSCRTYVSNYINNTYHCSFSDYINRLRVEHAKHLLKNGRTIKMTVVAELSGFSSEHSFYRNFKKFVGMTPADWLKSID